MRTQLPVLTRNEVISHRLPPHEALIRNVILAGFENTANYIKQLITYQEFIRDQFGPDTNVWFRPRLLDSRSDLENLQVRLQLAESSHNRGDYGAEIDHLLSLAIEYGFGSEDWWWMGHQLLQQCVSVSVDFAKDSGKRQALSRYAYGKFLLENLHDNDSAEEHLRVAKDLSTGMSWDVRKEFKDSDKTLFSEITILLHRVVMKKVVRMMKLDPVKAIELCNFARKSAADGCDYTGETKALILKGQCEMNVFDTANAILSFLRASAIQKTHENPECKCDTMVHLAMAYIKNGELDKALNKLQELKTYAEKFNLKFYIAQSYKYLGEYYLRDGKPSSATPLLITALRIFNEGKHITEAENTRNFAAISIGIGLMSPYLQLIVNCDKSKSEYRAHLKKLLRWKDIREPFWPKAAKTLGSKQSELTMKSMVQHSPSVHSRSRSIRSSIQSIAIKSGSLVPAMSSASIDIQAEANIFEKELLQEVASPSPPGSLLSWEHPKVASIHPDFVWEPVELEEEYLSGLRFCESGPCLPYYGWENKKEDKHPNISDSSSYEPEF